MVVSRRSSACERDGAPYFPENWPHFVAQYWNRQATVIRNPLTWPLAASEEILTALKSVARQFRDDAERPSPQSPNTLPIESEERRSEVKLLFNNMRLLGAEVDPLLPNQGDASLDQYSERLSCAAAQRDVMLYVTGFQRYALDIWERACQFLAPLYALVGMPAGYADLELFMGRYATTPGGVHRDRGTNFHFVLCGQKKMHIWPRSQFWSEPIAHGSSYRSPRGTDFRPLEWREDLGDAITLTATPGNVFHWAIDHWHVGESPEFSVSLNIALYLHGSPWKLLERGLSGEVGISEIASYPFLRDAGSWREPNLPASISGVLESLAEAASSQRGAFLAVQELLRKTTGFAFGAVPPRDAPRLVRAGDVLDRLGLFPVLFQRVGDRLIYSANGHVADTPNAPGIVHLLEAINHELPARADVILCRSCGEDEPRGLAILQELMSMRAIRKID